MRIERVRLVNVKSYVDTVVELRPGICVIAGPNGAGKSTLVEAIGLALFDAVPPWVGNEQARLVRRGASSGSIEVVFVHRGERLVVERVIGSRGRWTVYDEAGQALTGGGVRETAEWLRVRLGVRDVAMDKLFSDIVGTYQGCFTAPFEAPPRERTEKFERMLQVDEWRGMADGLGRRARSALEARASALGRSQEGLGQMIADRGEQAAEASLLREEAELARAAQADARAATDRADGELRALERVVRALRDAVMEVRAAEGAIAGHQAALAAATAAVNTARTAAAVCADTQAPHQAFVAAEQGRRGLEALREERGRHERALVAAINEAAANAATAQAMADAVRRRAATLADERAGALARAGAAEVVVAEATRAVEVASAEVARVRGGLAPAEAVLATARATEAEVAALAALLVEVRARLGGVAAETAELCGLDEVAARAAGEAAAEQRVEAARMALAALEAALAEKRGLAEGAGRGQCPLLEEACPHPRGLDLAGSVRGGIAALERRGGEARVGLQRAQAELAACAVARREVLALEARQVALLAERGRVAQLLVTHGQRAQVLLSRLGAAEAGAAGRGKRGFASGRTGVEAELEVALRAGEALGRSCATRVKAAIVAASEALERAREAVRAPEAALEQLVGAAGAARAALVAAQAEVARIGREEALHARARAEAERAAEATRAAELRKQGLESQGVRFVGVDERLLEVQAVLDRTREAHDRYRRAETLAAGLGVAEAKCGLAAAEVERMRGRAEVAASKLARVVGDARETVAEEAEPAGSTSTGTSTGTSTDTSTDTSTSTSGDLVGEGEWVLAVLGPRGEEKGWALEVARTALTLAEHRVVDVVARLRMAEEAERKVAGWRRDLAALEERRVRLEETTRVARGLGEQVFKKAGARIAERQVERVGLRAAELYRRIAPGDNLELRWNPHDYGVELCGLIDGREETLVYQQLSGGQKMTAALAVRLSLVRAFAGQIGLVCLDEPTTHLDQGRRGELSEALARLRGDGGTWFEQLLLVSHDDAFEALDEGRITLTLDPVNKATRVEGALARPDEHTVRPRPGRRRAARTG